jgi:hypothetical protein
MAKLRPTAEQERAALAWATEALRIKKAQLQKGYVDTVREDVVAEFVEFNDFLLKKGANFSAPLLPSVKHEISWAMRNTCAVLLKRDGQVPPHLVDFAAAALREPEVAPKPGPKKIDLIFRDIIVASVVYGVMGIWGFKRTRSRYNNNKAACAVSIVQMALVAGTGLHMAEDDIIRAANKFECFMLVMLKHAVEHPEILEFEKAREREQDTEAYRFLGDLGFKPDEAFAELLDLTKKPEFQQLVRDGSPDSATQKLRRNN